jgi:hypothetical protein
MPEAIKKAAIKNTAAFDIKYFFDLIRRIFKLIISQQNKKSRKIKLKIYYLNS